MRQALGFISQEDHILELNLELKYSDQWKTAKLHKAGLPEQEIRIVPLKWEKFPNLELNGIIPNLIIPTYQTCWCR